MMADSLASRPGTDLPPVRPWLAALRSRVARRVVLLFFVCTLVPMGAVGIVSYAYVGRQLTRDAETRVERGAKLSGQAVIEHLGNIEGDLRAAARTLSVRDPATYADSVTVVGTEAVLWVHPRGAHVIAGARFEPPPLTVPMRQHLEAGGSVVLHGRGGDGEPAVLMAHGAGPDDPRGILWAVIDPRYVAERLAFAPNDATVCLFGGGRAIACPMPGADGLRAALAEVGGGTLQQTSAGAPRRVLRWRDAAGRPPFVVGYWEVFLRPSFLTDPWYIAVAESRASVLQPLASFNRTFPFMLLLALWVVLLVSHFQIRRLLEPLRFLMAGTGRVGRRDFSEPVVVRSGDEFEQLAGSFNAMAQRLDRQFRALEARSHIDRAVLAALDVERIAAAVLNVVPPAVGSDGVALGLAPDGEPGSWHLMTQVGATGPAPGQAVPTPAELVELEGISDPRWFPRGAVPSYVARPLAASMGVLVLPLRLERRTVGVLVLGYRHGAPSGDEVEAASQAADQVAVALANARLLSQLDRMSWGTVAALARAIDAKSHWTAGHSERVTDLALAIGRRLGLDATSLDNLHRGALLHDVGKIGVAADILDKVGPLSPAEHELMRRHVRIGAEILAPIPAYAGALPVVLHHHERWDGTGYPDGLRAEAIPLLARVLAVADTYDALTSDRPYRPGLPPADAVARIRQAVATQFDPAVADALLGELAGRGVVAAGDSPA
jgi:GAF domain-containing protein